MIVRPWEEGDTEKLDLQAAQGYSREWLEGLDMEGMSVRGLAWVAEAPDGAILGIGGLLPLWAGRAAAWTFLSKDCGKAMIPLVRAMDRMIIRSGIDRVEATVDVGFKPGVRMMAILGFELEGYMKKYRPDGGDALLFARVSK